MSLSRILRIVLLILVPIAVFLVIAEVGLRFYLTKRIFYDVEMSRYAQLLKVESDNPLIGHEHRPNGSAVLMGVPVEINSDGLRDDEHAKESDGRRRLLFLGDSLTFGWGVARDDMFAQLLEKRLSESEPTEVINFGTGNYNTTQELNLFLEKGLAYHPDEVVVFYFINDAEPVPQKSPWSFLANFRIVTFYWSRMKQLVARLSPGQTYREYYAGLYEPEQPGWMQTKESLLELARVCRENGIGLSVVLLPELHEPAHYPFQKQHDQVAAILREHGIRVLDLAPAFADVEDPHTLWVSQDDAHPNALAHRRIADASLAFLSKRGTDAP